MSFASVLLEKQAALRSASVRSALSLPPRRRVRRSSERASGHINFVATAAVATAAACCFSRRRFTLRFRRGRQGLESQVGVGRHRISQFSFSYCNKASLRLFLNNDRL